MAVTYGFYDSKPNSSRKYNALEMSSLFDGIIEDGVFEHYKGKLAVTAGSGMSVTVATGRAWFDHTWTLNDAAFSISITPAAGSQKRTDAVVVDVDRGTRTNDIKLVSGTNGSADPPSLTNTSTHKQYPLAYVHVTGSTITSVEPTVPSITPWVVGAVQSINIANQIAAWQAAWAEKLQDDYSLKVVRYDQVQSLTSTQKKIARMNIDAAARSSIANNYSSSTTYKVGQYVYFDGNLHRSKVSNNKGHEPLNTSNDAYWTAATTLAGNAYYYVSCLFEQDFTSTQKKLARDNIDAASIDSLALEWDESKKYYIGDIVSYKGSVYYLNEFPAGTSTMIGHLPPNTDSLYWTRVPAFTALFHHPKAKIGAILYTVSQELSDNEKAIARSNIGVGNALNSIVPAYNKNGTYRVGQFVSYDDKLYYQRLIGGYSPNGANFNTNVWVEKSLGEVMATVVRTDIRQNLTEEEKARARANLDITSAQDAVSYSSQNRTEEQQLQARKNIGFTGNFVNTGYHYLSQGYYIDELHDTYDTFEEYLIRYPDLWPDSGFPTTVGDIARYGDHLCSTYTFWAYDCVYTGPGAGENTGLMFLEFMFVGEYGAEIPPSTPCDRFCKVTKYNYDGSFERKLYFNTTLLSHEKTDENGTEFITPLVNAGQGSGFGESRTDVSIAYTQSGASSPVDYLASLSAGNYILSDGTYSVIYAENVVFQGYAFSKIHQYTDDGFLYEYVYVDGVRISEIEYNGASVFYATPFSFGTPTIPSHCTNKEYVDTNAGNMQSITYSALKTLRTNGKLVPGKQYRITDYICTTTQADTRVVSHPFDIIVTADSTTALNENARACLHAGDDYYSSNVALNDLGAWELKYCLDNDTQRFSWADETNGKGVVYWLKDDWGNECPYDFKQIQFKRYKILQYNEGELDYVYVSGEDVLDENGQPQLDNAVWVYTFCLLDSQNNAVDLSVMQRLYRDDENMCNSCANNRIGACIAPDLTAEAYIYCIPDNAFVTDGDFTSDYAEVLMPEGNILGPDCSKNTFTGHVVNNTLGAKCSSNAFGDDCIGNILEFWNTNILLANSCSRNRFEQYARTISLYQICNNNVFGANSYSIILGDSGFGNRIDADCTDIVAGTGVAKCQFGPSCSHITLCGYCKACVFEPGTEYVTVSCLDASSSNLVQNYHVLAGTKGTSNHPITVSADYNLAYCTYVGKNRSGTVKTVVLADLVE